MISSCKWPSSALTVLALHLVSALPTPAASFGTNSIADSFVATGATGSLVNNNYGGGGALSIAAAALSEGEFQNVLRFNLAGAQNSFDSLYGPGQWTVQSLTLQLTATAPNNALFNTSGAGQFGISRMQIGSWTEGAGTPGAPAATGLTFNSLTNSFISGGDESLGTFSFGGGTNGANIYTLSLAGNLSADVLAGNVLSLRLFAADNTVSYLFNAREFGAAANRPLLTVSAVPEPASVVFGALGIAWLAARKGFARTRKP